MNLLAFVWYERNGEERNRRKMEKFSCLVRREIEKKEKKWWVQHLFHFSLKVRRNRKEMDRDENLTNIPFFLLFYK